MRNRTWPLWYRRPMGRRRHAGIILTGLALFALVGAAASSGASSSRPVQVKTAKINTYRWFETVARGPHVRTCVGISTKDLSAKGGAPETEFNEGSSALCAPLRPKLTPNILSSSVGEGTSKESEIVAIIAAPSVVRMRLNLGPDGTRLLRLPRMTNQQAGAAGTARVRYAGFGIDGASCIVQVTSLDRSGRVLYRSSKIPCQRY